MGNHHYEKLYKPDQMNILKFKWIVKEVDLVRFIGMKYRDIKKRYREISKQLSGTVMFKMSPPPREQLQGVIFVDVEQRLELLKEERMIEHMFSWRLSEHTDDDLFGGKLGFARKRLQEKTPA